MRAHTLADDEELVDSQLLRDLGAGPPRDDDRLDPGQLTLQVLGELTEQHVADDRPEDRIPEELQPLIRDQAMVRSGCVREGLPEKVQVAKAITDDLLALGQ